MYLLRKRSPLALSGLGSLPTSRGKQRLHKVNQVYYRARGSNSNKQQLMKYFLVFLLGCGICLHIIRAKLNNNNICPVPDTKSTSWKYYRALVDINSNLAEKASRVAEFSPPLYSRPLLKESSLSPPARPQIPHRLIFTHKVNLFDCSSSASAMTPPEVYMLAENAKATVSKYRQIWDDLEVVFLNDVDCKEVIEVTEPRLLEYFDGLDGMIKADLCRAADLFLNGGYYFDADILVVHPYVAADDLSFATVKAVGFPETGFFQAFLAAAPNNEIIGKSLETMLGQLNGSRQRHINLGTVALYEAYNEVEEDHGKKIEGSHLLAEVHMASTDDLSDKYKNLHRQFIPGGYGKMCHFVGDFLCNHVVMDDSNDSIYFYSRVIGAGVGCGRRDKETCPPDLFPHLPDDLFQHVHVKAVHVSGVTLFHN